MNSTEALLNRKFEDYRIVCWRDVRNELQEEFDSLDLPGVEKIVVDHNEFSIMYRVLRKEPKQKFLIFTTGPEPPKEENWLLDLEETYGVFRADQTSLWLGELGLGYEYEQCVKDHSAFFQSEKRRKALKKRIQKEDSQEKVKLKILAVSVECDSRFDCVLEKLLADAIDNDGDKFNDIKAWNLEAFFWKKVEQIYGYHSSQPTVKDFIFSLFRTAFWSSINADWTNECGLTEEAMVFLNRFKDSRTYSSVYEKCSRMVSESFDVFSSLRKYNLNNIGNLDVFEEIDIYILQELARQVNERTISAADCTRIVRLRRQTFWYRRFENAYQAIDFASLFLQTWSLTQISFGSLYEGFNKYVTHYFQLDQFYRRFIGFARAANQVDLLEKLIEKVENFYSNQYLLKLNNKWQDLLNGLTKWQLGQPRQERFFEGIKTILEKKKKVCVIISDALRYEIADELRQKLTIEDRYTANLQARSGLLPSITSVGMAALLPHKTLTYQTTDNGISVLADDMSTQGTAAREKVLKKAVPNSAVITAEELLAKNKENGRTLFKENDVIYVYHNQIDKVGDDRTSESQVCQAAETAITEIITIIKKLAGFNATNFIVTADHGFIYQDRELPEDDFLPETPSGGICAKVNRRYVIGEELVQTDGLQLFTTESLEVQGTCEIQIAKSINRLRSKGSGSRYVHGGASLQEIVIPLLKVNKKRSTDTTLVDVEIIPTIKEITSAQIAVKLYQVNPVSDKILPRKLKLGLFASSGELISEEKILLFDSPEIEVPLRESTCQLILTRECEKYNNQDVLLKLQEPINGTSVYKDYRTITYLLRRQVTELDF